MAKCNLCGEWAGLGSSEHPLCREAVDAGKPLPDGRGLASTARAVPLPLTPRSIFWAIFGALWAFSVSAGIVYALIRAIS
jgi:hypothetical protein